MNYKCYMCKKEIKAEHFFLVRYKDKSRIMCRKCGLKWRREKDADRQGKSKCTTD